MTESTDKKSIYDYDLARLTELLISWGEPEYRSKQIWGGLYTQLWSDAQQFSNLPKTLRTKIDSYFEFERLTPVAIRKSKDGETQKTLFKLSDEHAVEAVLMRYSRRRTLCISTQAGCALGCVFCATGQMGFKRNLSSGEIVEQVLFYARELALSEERVTNIVIMGMGEPFHNYENTIAAIDRLNHKAGFNLGARRFTISTVGLVPEILRFANERRQVNLAVSLHAVDDELRSSLLPINKKYPVKILLDACLDYVNITHRRITFEWALINDINDSRSQALELAKNLKIFNLAGSILCHVNVIPLNPTGQYAGKATTRARAKAFQSVLEQNGIPCTIRVRRGVEIQAGCGQLAVDSSLE